MKSDDEYRESVSAIFALKVSRYRRTFSASASEHPRLPLVFSSRRAAEQAERLLPGRCLENLVQIAIERGDVSHEPRNGARDDLARVQLEGGLIALVGRDRRRPSGRKCWTIVALRSDERGAA